MMAMLRRGRRMKTSKKFKVIQHFSMSTRFCPAFCRGVPGVPGRPPALLSLLANSAYTCVMYTVNATELKNRLGPVLARAELETVAVMRHGRVVAYLTPARKAGA